MKKRALSLLLCLVFLVGLMPTTALAAGATGTWAVKLNVSESDAYSYNGQKVLALGFGVQSDDLKVKTAQSVVFAFDLEIFDFLESPNDDDVVNVFNPSTTGLSENEHAPSTGAKIGKVDWSPWVAYGKSTDGKTGYMQIIASSSKGSSVSSATDLATAYLGFKSSKSVSDLQKNSIRFITKEECAALNQTSAVEITDGTTANKQYATLKDGSPDTLKISPEVVWNDITPSAPAKTTPTCVAPTGVTAPFGSALSTITLANPATNTSGTWYWMDDTQKVGNVKDNPHTYKAKFVSTDATTYATVEDIDVKVTATKVTLPAGSPIMISIEETYTGSVIEPKPSIRVSDMHSDELVLDQDYKITKYENNKNVGKGKIFIEPLATGNYNFTAGSYPFTIKRATGSISIADPGTIAYDGSVVEAGTSGKDLTYTYKGDGSVTVKWYADNSGTKGSELTGGAPKDAGTYWIGVSAADGTNYFGVSEVTKKFTISPAEYSFTKPATDTATINQPRPTSAPATANGVPGETVSGTLSWYTDSTCNTAASGNFTTAGKEELYWKFTPNPAETNYVTTPKTGKVTYTVSNLPAQTVSFADAGPITKTFGDPVFTNAATSTDTTSTITYASDKPAVATVNSTTGEVTIKGAGTAIITATAAATSTHAEGQASYTLTVSPKTIALTVTVTGTYTYNGDPITPTYTVEISSGTALPTDQYDVELTDNTNAGTAHLKIKAKADGNYSFGTFDQPFTIGKKKAPELTAKALDQFTLLGVGDFVEPIVYGVKGETLEGTITYDVGGTAHYPDKAAVVAKLKTMAAGASLPLNYHFTPTSANYLGAKTGNFTITVQAKADVSGNIAFSDGKLTYNGSAQTYEKASIDGITAGANPKWTYTYAAADATATLDGGKPKTAGTYTVTAVYEDDNNYGTKSAKLTINKATPTGTPTYTAITTSGKKLSDAALAIGSITPTGGTIKWDMADTTEVTANTAYGWTYTPTDTVNYNPLKSSVTPYVVAYSGGSYTPTYTITVDKTANGTVTAAPGTAKAGDTVTLTATPDKGYELDTIKALDKDGKELKLTDQGNGKYTFTMPAGKVTVKAVFEDSNLVMFDDVSKGDYCYEAVKWAVKNGITSGIGNNRFGPNDPCTRGQIVTFLWRAAGSPEPKSMSSFTDVPADSYYAKAVAWAVEKGITSGTGDGKFSPEDPCTRAQSVTFLYRAAGSPAVSGSAEFSDVASDTYYAAAVAWAAKNGITSGIGGGQFGSDDECSRGHIVTFLFNAYGK